MTSRYTSVVERDALDADNAGVLAAYLTRVDSGSRIGQLEVPSAPAEADLARMLTERFANDPEAFEQLLESVRVGLLARA